MEILIDDIRNFEGLDIIVRTPVAAFAFLEVFDFSGHILYMDNDLGVEGLENEGRTILKRILEKQQLPSKVMLVTSNIIAKADMVHTLQDAGYSLNKRTQFFELQENLNDGTIY